MKLKKLLLITCALLVVMKTSAQDKEFDKSWRFGLKAAPSLNWFKTDTKGIESDGAKLGFSWGFMAEYYFASNYAFATGIDVGGYGGKLVSVNAGEMVENDVRLSYIDLPISVKMRTNEIGYMRYFGQFGFTPGINIAAKTDLKYTAISPTGSVSATTEDLDFKNQIVPLNVGLLIALGAEYSLSGNTSMVFSVSFHNGFLDVADFKITDPNVLTQSKSVKMNANAVRLNVGILF